MRYTDFQLLAQEPQCIKAEGKKRLTFNLVAPGVLSSPLPSELDVLALSDLKEKVSGADATWSDARGLGEGLASALFPTAVWNALNNRLTQAAASHEGVRVRLMLAGAELNNWPWEFILFNRAGGESKDSDFLALMPHVSLVRHTAAPLPAWRVEAKGPASVLVAVASPRTGGWPKLKVMEECSVIEKALKGCTGLKVSSVEHAKRGQLPNKASPAHLFHFAGHGKFEELLSSVPGAHEGTASIILEDEYGDPDPLNAETLAVQLRDAGVRVAVLGACQTAQRDDVNAWSSVAEALLKAELGAVVGMQFPVEDTSALRFAERFYGALAVGLSIDEAVAAGRVAVAALGDARGWATPVLYLRSPDGIVFNEFASDPALETPRVKASQEIDVLRGKAKNVRITAMRRGHVEAGQRAKVVEKGASLHNVVIKAHTGGAVVAKQKIGEVKGTATNVSIDELGFGNPTVHSRADVGEVKRGASVTGVKIGKIGGDRLPKRTAARTQSGEQKEARRERPTVTSTTKANKVTGGKLIGTEFNVRNVTIVSGAEPKVDEHAVEERVRLDVALPKSAVINEPFDIVIAVRQPDAAVLTVADLDQVVSAEGSIFRSEEQDVVKYRVEVTGIGFEVTPKNYLIALRPGANSRPVAFQVTSSKTGKRSLLVNAYQEDEALAAQTRLTIEVVVAVGEGQSL